MKHSYQIERENAVSGSRIGSSQIYHSETPLTVGKLYFCLPGLQGCYRVLREVEVEQEEKV